MKPSKLFGGALALAGVCAFASLAGAQMGAVTNQPPTNTTAKPAWFAVQEGRNAPAQFVLPAAPALPSGCTAPTKDQCIDATYYKTNACAKPGAASSTAMRNYCTWVLQKEWTTSTTKPVAPTSFPMSNPTSAYPSLAVGRRSDHGKKFEPTIVPNSTQKRKKSPKGTSTPYVNGTAPKSNWVPRNSVGSNGSYATATSNAVLGGASQVDGALAVFDNNWAIGANQQGAANTAMGLIAAKPSFVHDGASVSSCEEYAYKRWGPWSLFSFGAKKLGPLYRAVYNIAMDPASPVYINRQMNQIGTNTPIPRQIWEVVPGTHIINTGPPQLKLPDVHEARIPYNAFFANKPDFIDTATGLSPTDKTNMWAAYNARPGSGVAAKSDFSPLGVHKEAHDALVGRWGNPLDEDIQDMQRRQEAYLDLLSKRAEILVEKFCARADDPCFRCHPRPQLSGHSNKGLELPAIIAKIQQQISGDPRINPAEIVGLVQTGSPVEYANTRNALIRSSAAIHELNQIVGGINMNGVNVPSGLKQKAPPVAPTPSKNTSNTPPPMNACLGALYAERTVLEATQQDVDTQLARIFKNEMTLPDKGCLKDPGPGNTNACDWNYEYFAGIVTDIFTSGLEADLRQCQTEVANAAGAASVIGAGAFSTVLKQANEQELIFPCVLRRDFSGDAVKVRDFLDKNQAFMGRYCESYRENKAILDVQSSYADAFEGFEWKPGEGRVVDSENDTQDMGGDGLGAKFSYNGSWDLKRAGLKPGSTNEFDSCMFEGTAKNSASALVHFFGDDIELMASDSEVNAKSAPGVLKKHYAYYNDIEAGSRHVLANENNKALATPYGDFDPFLSLGGADTSFRVTIGPYWLKIVFGFGANAGVKAWADAKVGNNCSNMQNASNFRLVTGLEPWAQANAYADASLDYVVASAGVRLDLTLLRLSIPLGVDVENTNGKDWLFANGGHIGIDMLAGRLSGYVTVGVPPLDVTVSAELTSWPGFHADIAAWGVNRTVPAEAVRSILAKFVKPESVSCKCNTQENICCSNLAPPKSCPSNKCGAPPVGAETHKFPNQTTDGWLCRFTDADLADMHLAVGSCKDFTRPAMF